MSPPQQVKAQDPVPKGGEVIQTLVGTAFTYQGRLTDTAGNPIPGPCDFMVNLYDTQIGGTPVAPTFYKNNQALSNGYFILALVFGAQAFYGSERWLAIGVACPAGTAYYMLDERTAITAVPYAHGLVPKAILCDTNPDYILMIDNDGAGDGLSASTSAAQANYAAVYASNNSTGTAVYGVNSGWGHGVYGFAAAGGYGVYGKETAGGYAVYSDGDAKVKGDAYIEGNLSWFPKRSYLSVPAAAFQPLRSDTAYENWGSHVYPTGGEELVFMAPVELPYGAKIVGMEFFYEDTSTHAMYASLNWYAIGTYEHEMAIVWSYGPGNNSTYTPDINDSTVDNEHRFYFLQLFFQVSEGLEAVGVVIEYNVSAPH